MAEECSLLNGPVAVSAQFVLLFIVIGALLWKRWRETPRRPWNIWSLDVSKQAFSSGAAHICGIIIATYVGNRHSSASECGWYFVVYTVDTTLGVIFAVSTHWALVKLASFLRSRASPPSSDVRSYSTLVFVLDSLKATGNYGVPVSYSRFAVQAAEWVFSTILARFLCGVIVASAANSLSYVATRVDSLFPGNPNLELFFVMVTCPLLMNVLQAVVQDQVLKFRAYQKRRTEDQDGVFLLEQYSSRDTSAPSTP